MAYADVVVPISYRIGSSGQGAHDLRAYKAAPKPIEEARRRVLSLLLLFLDIHEQCVLAHLGASKFTHVAFVPSTKNPNAVHPLRSLATPFIAGPTIDLAVNPHGGVRRPRNFHADMFVAPTFSDEEKPASVLLLDDTWVSGATAQSAAHRLKQAGAHKVAVVTVARQLNEDYGPAQSLIKMARETRFDPDQCVLHTTQ